jgi:hypothetical protein
MVPAFLDVLISSFSEISRRQIVAYVTVRFSGSSSEVSGAVVDTMLDTDIPAATQLLSPRNFMNNGATAAAVAYDCSGVYVETDY